MKMRKIAVEVTALEELTHVRAGVMLVPQDMTDEEVKQHSAEVFDEGGFDDWEVEDSTGIWTTGNLRVLGKAEPDAVPELILELEKEMA